MITQDRELSDLPGADEAGRAGRVGLLPDLAGQAALPRGAPAAGAPIPPGAVARAQGTPNVAHLVSWDHSQSWSVVTYNDFPTSVQVSEDGVEFELKAAGRNDGYLAANEIDGRVLVPATGYMVLAWKSLAKRSGKPYTQVPVVFEDVTLHRSSLSQ
ncbi:hypothetical protein HPB47_017833 [Ixodes persulcatus]|uniref:Uncharacterized protein n=1 Tax=Ixodes persulcatus TaxID=34615 RepID=A0AC60QR08_IXOPE|nr:hypothetical protein HPB47_017833 [Ixodes persulcatus]